MTWASARATTPVANAAVSSKYSMVLCTRVEPRPAAAYREVKHELYTNLRDFTATVADAGVPPYYGPLMSPMRFATGI